MTDPLAGTLPDKPLRIWAMHCPFRKTGSPVLGSMGSSVQPVIVMTLETWQALCQRDPTIQTMPFEVGTYD